MSLIPFSFWKQRQNEIITDGLVMYLDAGNSSSYPGSGTTWSDLTDNSNDGVLGSGVEYSSNYGGILVFDGNASTDLSYVPNSTSLNFTSGLTISSWFRFASLPPQENPIVRKEIQWAIELLNTNTIRCLIWTDGVNGWTAANDVSYSFLTNTWYNMTMTYNGSNMLIYVNNSLVKTATVTGNIVARNTQVNIGYYGNQVLNGNISQISIYNRALNSTELSQNYNITKQRYGL